MLVLAAVVALATPVAAEAANGAPKVTVMTRNLFLGADLSPAIQAPRHPVRDRRRGDGVERAPEHEVPGARGAARA